MGSILEFLKEVDLLTADESIIQTPYSRTSALELRVIRDNLEKSFNENPTGMDTRTLYTRANSVALGLEWHLSVANEKYREKVKRRNEANVLFQNMNSILTDFNMRKSEFNADDIAIAEFAILMNDSYKYYKHAQNFVWNRTVHDDILVEKIKSFMEEYKNGTYFSNSIIFRDSIRSQNESDVDSASIDDSCDNCGDSESIEEQTASTISDSSVHGDSSSGDLHSESSSGDGQ
jgi:hypothetical protein